MKARQSQRGTSTIVEESARRLPLMFGATALALALILALGPSLARAQQSPASTRNLKGIVYTADEHGNSVSAIDLASGKVQIVPIPISAHNVQSTADGSRLLAVGAPAGDGHGHRAKAAHDQKEAKGRLLLMPPN